MDNHHFNSWIDYTWAIFYSYVRLPEGTLFNSKCSPLAGRLPRIAPNKSTKVDESAVDTDLDDNLWETNIAIENQHFE